ncbi:Pumilio-family RNA binding repeat containing protein [Tritrichomonas foetus]|uniref:Pumilio-family RNA binding repeat containing protein n=1 Tax=Tritrichomonas foetus TaxID=1144522 RepID=A0A1J4L1V8_9EUKA|nr:Pumilio-family RNA binding repeat containing protein [Tritrichomonas foetus]|eukprot:OHT17056.1 Pumilio-family RNA binding repeat containing protein [Tritrichomonas foetus]
MTSSFDSPIRQIRRCLTPNGPSSINTRPMGLYNSLELDSNSNANSRVHLIQSDLWEAITGEHLSPQNICQLCDISIPNPDVSSIALQYLHMSKDRQGSRALQTKIQECSPAERSVIFAALLPALNELVYDPCSNYVIQKLCEYTNSETDQQFLQFFLENIDAVVDHPNGCRVLQKFIENTNKNNVDQIYVALRDKIEPMCMSPNGNHIVQRFIEMLPNRVPEIINIIESQVTRLVIDSCGCRVVQKLFDRYDIRLLRPLVDEVLTCAADLAENQYGNYVVQNILDAGPESDIEQLLEDFRGGFYAFSIHKFASNVMERCIRRANGKQRQEIFTEIIGKDGFFDEGRILKMVTDQFGNYVIQRIIEFGTESQQTAIYNVVYDHYDEAIKRQYAKHVISKLEDLGYEF